MIHTNLMMLILGLTLFVFGVVVSVYARQRLRHLGVGEFVGGPIRKPSLSVIVRRNRMRSWKAIALVVALIGVLITVLGFIR